MADKIFTTDGNIISDGFPQIQIGDKLYRVDTRKSTYDKVQKLLEGNGKKPADQQVEEDRIILEATLGKEALAEIDQMDLTISGFMNLLVYVQAAMFDITFEEAKARFQKSGLL